MTDREQYAKVLEAFNDETVHTVLEGEALRAGSSALRELEAMENGESGSGAAAILVFLRQELDAATARADAAEKALGEARVALDIAADTFRNYSVHHAARGDEEKATANFKLAVQMRQAINGGKG